MLLVCSSPHISSILNFSFFLHFCFSPGVRALSNWLFLFLNFSSFWNSRPWFFPFYPSLNLFFSLHPLNWDSAQVGGCLSLLSTLHFSFSSLASCQLFNSQGTGSNHIFTNPLECKSFVQNCVLLLFGGNSSNSRGEFSWNSVKRCQIIRYLNSGFHLKLGELKLMVGLVLCSVSSPKKMAGLAPMPGSNHSKCHPSSPTNLPICNCRLI